MVDDKKKRVEVEVELLNEWCEKCFINPYEVYIASRDKALSDVLSLLDETDKKLDYLCHFLDDDYESFPSKCLYKKVDAKKVLEIFWEHRKRVLGLKEERDDG